MDLDDLEAFLAVVRTGSVAAAAETLSVPRSTLRRRLDELEARAGVPLLLRSPAGVQLSPAGEVLAHRGRLLSEQYNALIESVREEGQALHGLVRLATPVGLPGELLEPLLQAVARLHPGLQLELVGREDPLDCVPREAHLAVWIGGAAPPGPWAAAPFATLDEGAWALGSWLDRVSLPAEPARLPVRAAWAVGRRWPLRAGGFVETEPLLCADDAGVVEALGREGGVVWLPSVVARRAGFRAVSPRQLGRIRTLWAVAPQGLAGVARIREVLEAAAALQR